MVRRNSRSETRTGSTSIAYQNFSVSGNQQLQYYNNDFLGHFKNSRANQAIKSDQQATDPSKLKPLTKFSNGHRNSRSISNNLGLTAPNGSGKALIQGSQSSSFLQQQQTKFEI